MSTLQTLLTSGFTSLIFTPILGRLFVLFMSSRTWDCEYVMFFNGIAGLFTSSYWWCTILWNEGSGSDCLIEKKRDNIGIGGSWSEFIDYFVASIKSEDVKLVMHGQSDSGATSAKLVAQKAKGMPLILVTLVKLVDFAARELMGNLSMQLFMALKNTRTSLAEEQERSRQLTKLITAEKNESIQNKLESFSKKQKLPITSALAMSDASDPSTEKVVVQDATSTRVTNRVVPSHRRSKVRGVLLQNPEDD
ncbi:photosystem I assembly protein Ycf4 isoform X2 [Rhodamnia argentea]|uniref:Photosystem I assembly protein Ycf4 isoform X2 n=1 Tax=Rhodamnia argentea TaxID=178133 RepID=A0ABM3GWH9_9MYRT|nr:photosystem I assembly protein Ycf4 isoform X2 [Rhodamnia argentea]